jgi:chromosome segregation ATPase
MTDYQKNKIQNKLQSLKNQIENYESLNQNTVFKLNKIISTNNLVNLDLELRQIEHNLKTTKNKLKIVEIKKQNINKNIRNIPADHKNLLNKEETIYFNELDRIKQKREIITEDYQNRETNIKNMILELEEQLSTSVKNKETTTSEIKKISVEVQNERRVILNNLKAHKNSIKNKSREINKITNKIQELENKLVVKELELEAIPTLKRNINKKYYQIENQVKDTQNKLDTLKEQIRNVVTKLNKIDNSLDINENKESKKNVRDSTQSELLDLWKQRDDLQLQITRLQNQPEMDITSRFLELDNKYVDIENQIKIVKDEIVQFTTLKTDLENVNIKPVSSKYDNNLLKSLKRKSHQYEIEIDNYKNNLHLYYQELNKEDSFYQDTLKTLNNDKTRAEERWNIMQNRLLTWKDDQSIEYKNKILELVDDINNFKKEIQNIIDSQNLVNQQIKQKMESAGNPLDWTNYISLKKDIIKNNGVIDSINDEINQLESLGLHE